MDLSEKLWNAEADHVIDERDELEEKVKHLRQQRDDLLAACKAASKRFKTITSAVRTMPTHTRWEQASQNRLYAALDGWEDICNAIASATGDGEREQR